MECRFILYIKLIFLKNIKSYNLINEILNEIIFVLFYYFFYLCEMCQNDAYKKIVIKIDLNLLLICVCILYIYVCCLSQNGVKWSPGQHINVHKNVF